MFIAALVMMIQHATALRVVVLGVIMFAGSLTLRPLAPKMLPAGVQLRLRSVTFLATAQLVRVACPRVVLPVPMIGLVKVQQIAVIPVYMVTVGKSFQRVKPLVTRMNNALVHRSALRAEVVSVRYPQSFQRVEPLVTRMNNALVHRSALRAPMVSVSYPYSPKVVSVMQMACLKLP